MTEALKLALARLGPLRIMLIVAALLAVMLMPAPGTPADYAGWGFIQSVVIPVLAPMVFMVLLLDLLMSRIFMKGSETFDRGRYLTIITAEGICALLLLLRFLPFILALGR